MPSDLEMQTWGFGGVLQYELHLPLETPSNNTIKGMHFQAYRTTRKAWRLMIQAALKGYRPDQPVEVSGLVVIRYSAGSLDWDNAYGGLKPVLDCLVVGSSRNPDGLGLIRDDNPTAMPYPPFVKQEKAKRGQGSTSIFIYKVDAALKA